METVLNRSVPLTDAAAGLPYIEREAVYTVHNRYLRVALVGAVAALLAVSGVCAKMVHEFANQKPIVVRINQDGTTSTAPYESLTYQPGAPEIQYFLTKFTEDHYGRVRSTVVAAFSRKQDFMTSDLARAVRDRNRKTKEVEQFVIGHEPNVEVIVTKVSIQDLRQSPYKAFVDFVLVYKAVGNNEETKRERYTAQYEVKRLQTVPNYLITSNPLGLQISYIREDQAFSEGK